MLLTLTVAAQDLRTQVEQLRTDMYRLYGTDSLQRFMDTTNKLKKAAQAAGDEKTFYRAWANQALFVFRKKDRKEGQAILEQVRSYADERDSKFGLYTSISVNTTFLSLLNMNDELEKEYQKCIDYVHQYFPKESAATDYLGLARLYYNNNQFGKVMDVAKKTLKEPNLNDTHRQIALAYICLAYSKMPEKETDLKTFNHYYQEFKEFREKTGRDTGMNDIVDFNYYQLNHQPLKALETAKHMAIPLNRLLYVAEAYEKLDSFKQAYYTMTAFRKLTDSLNSAESKKQATEHALQLNIARAENEAKDLRIENQMLELEHINDELEQKRLEEEALNLSLQKREAELINAATKLRNDSLDRYNKDLKISEYKSKLEAQQQKEHAKKLRLLSAAIIGLIVVGFLIHFFYRRQKHLKEIQTAYNKLEDAYGKLEATTKAKERIDSELRIARSIQESMVPRIFPPFPDRDDIDLYASMTPAKEVGGDLYDFFLLPPSLRDGDERLCFCIGDVSGKSVPASLFMSVVVNLFRIVAKEGKTPAEIATKVNEAVAADNENGMFATMFIGEIDLRTGVLEYCNCGHNPPVIGGQFLEMPEANAPIGLWPGLEFIGHSVEGMKDKMLLLYTDGVTEAENMDQKQTGDDWLIDILKEHPMDNARELIGDILREVATHVGDAEPSDDITLLCLKV
jgi:serine phosphatase RsbU (regulator of sigma subunit)